MEIKELAQKYKQYVIDMRRYFHMYPEPSLKEFRTSEKIKSELDKIGIEYTNCGETCIIGIIHGKNPGKTIALRADIDALSVTELNDIEYKSKNVGIMHACGHDCHASMLLGAGKILNELKDKLNGTVKLLFQPAEEVAQGAKGMIKNGALNDVDGVFGIHVWSDLDVGCVNIEIGPRMASADLFTINIKGKGGHGSAPHQGIDAVVTSCAIVMNLQSIISRELPPLDSAVVSIGSINSGSRFNVIASEGTLNGTTRCFNPEIRTKFPKMLERIAKSTAEAYRAEAKLEYTLGTPIVINNEKCTKTAQKSAEKIGAKLCSFEKITGGEDFAEYLNKVPGALAFVGVRNPKKDAIYPQHHPKYTVDEDCLEIGSALYAQFAVDFLGTVH